MKLLKKDCIRSGLQDRVSDFENECVGIVFENISVLFYLHIGSDLGYTILNDVHDLHIHNMTNLGFLKNIDEIIW